MQLKNYIRSIENHPVEGVTFRDITPILQNGPVFQDAIKQMAELVKDIKFDKVIGIEARGFIIGAPLATYLGCGFVPIRKPGKLPFEKVTQEYQLEYGSDSIEMHIDSLKEGERVLVVDDLLATGGTSKAASALIEKVGGKVESFLYLIELIDLEGRKKIGPYEVRSLLKY